MVTRMRAGRAGQGSAVQCSVKGIQLRNREGNIRLSGKVHV